MSENMSVVDRIGARMADALSSRVGYRSDFSLCDHRMAGPSLALVAVAYDPGVGKPNTQDIQDFVFRAFDGRLMPHMASTRLHPERKAFVTRVSSVRISREHKDIEKMMSLGGNRFIEASTKEIWEVEDNGGVLALYRVAEEDLETLLNERRGRQRFANARVSLDSLVEPGKVLATPGAQVLFYSEMGEEKVATVMSEADERGNVGVRVTGQKADLRIHENQIHEMLTTAELDADTKKKLKDYFTEAFGDAEYAQDLVTAKTIVGTKDQLVGFLTEANLMNPAEALAWTDTLRIARGKVFRTGPHNMILACYNGNGYEWEVDAEAAEKALATK
jgi:hypothetical protein